MRTCAICNSDAGDTAGICDWRNALAFHSDCDVLNRDHRGSMDEWIQVAVAEKYDRMIAVGGGTISRLVNTIQQRAADIEVGIVPTGTGNVARSLAIPLDSIEAAWQIAARSESSAIDVVQMINGGKSHFVNVATAGFGGRVVAEVMDERKQRRGGLACWFAALSNMADLEEHNIEIVLDSCRLKANALGLCIANGRFAGGGFAVAPQATFQVIARVSPESLMALILQQSDSRTPHIKASKSAGFDHEKMNTDNMPTRTPNWERSLSIASEIRPITEMVDNWSLY